MADWGKIGSRGEVEDRRAMGPTALGGGLGLAGVVIYLLFTYLSGGSVTNALIQLGAAQVQNQTQYSSQDFQGADAYETFTSTVLGSANDMWQKVFASLGKTYTPPKLVLFRGSTQSACDRAYTEEGPHYCPEDRTIYLDETFFEEIQSRFGGNTSDVAEAYVIAHEAGHHAQEELGVMDQVTELENQGVDENQLSVDIELQADCFAGLWAYSINGLKVFQPGEINEAISEAKAVGDDHIQEVETGRVNPEAWTHGSSLQRVDWFNKGYSTGSLETCNTFGQ